MSSSEEKIVEQISEIATTPLKNFLEVRKNRKNMLVNYGTQKEIELIDKVMSSDAIDLESKAFLASYIKSGAKKFYNQLRILGIALDRVKSEDNILEIDADWINDFWEKSKNISDESNQKNWANVLYYNFTKGTCTKTLLNALYLLDKRGMHYFDEVRKFSFSHFTDVERGYSCYYRDNNEIYRKYDLHQYGFYYLSTLGLVECDWQNEFILPTNNITLKYGEKVIDIKSNNRLTYGNARLTTDGVLLYKALQGIYDNDCLKFCINIWRERGAIVTVQ